jgi:hypothetical protein
MGGDSARYIIIYLQGIIMFTVAYHSRTDKDGWQEICRHPIDSPEWTTQDRAFISEMVKQGQMVLTCGLSMWNIVKGDA